MTKLQAIYGIDFSGARDAGNKIWITKGISDGETLIIEDCFRARDLASSGKDHKACLIAIVNLIKSSQNAVFGFDFPFGLPISLVREDSWEEFILGFPKKYKNPEELRKTCMALIKGDRRHIEWQGKAFWIVCPVHFLLG